MTQITPFLEREFSIINQRMRASGSVWRSHLLKTVSSRQNPLLKRINKNAMKLAALPAE
jgi:hypothetical protein